MPHAVECGNVDPRNSPHQGTPCLSHLLSSIVVWGLKDQRRRPEGGSEWEPIKIPRRNMAYITKRIWHSSLLTRPGPHSNWTAIGPRNRVRNCSENSNRCQQDHVRDRRQKLDRRTVYILTDISPNIWWARSGNQETNLNHESSSLWYRRIFKNSVKTEKIR
jgi:hypothetical protein